MGEVLMAASVLGIITYGILNIIKMITDFKIKKKLIDKDLVEKDISNLFAQGKPTEELPNKYASLKWGLVAFFGGMAFIAIDTLVPASELGHFNSPLAFGLLTTSIALGFLTYFMIVRKKGNHM